MAGIGTRLKRSVVSDQPREEMIEIGPDCVHVSHRPPGHSAAVGSVVAFFPSLQKSGASSELFCIHTESQSLSKAED